MFLPEKGFLCSQHRFCYLTPSLKKVAVNVSASPNIHVKTDVLKINSYEACEANEEWGKMVGNACRQGASTID